MISEIRGILRKVSNQYALVENGGLSYEIMVPSALAERLKQYTLSKPAIENQIIIPAWLVLLSK